MEEKNKIKPELNKGEARFLGRLAEKYADDPDAGKGRSFLIAAVALAALFSLSRWLPEWWMGLVAVEAVGLIVFYQYRRFARFKNRIMLKMWKAADGGTP